MILAAFKKVPNELNKKFSYKEVRKLPFKITITGRISASLTIENVTDELKSALETKFGRDSTFFDPNRVGKYILIKKDVWAFIENAGLFPRLLSGIVEWNESNGFYDFVYLDTENSTFNISYEEE
ncbi:bplA domain protein (plasmid) [Escherichia coli]|nr:bplA domain protein [Escherichia coli]